MCQGGALFGDAGESSVCSFEGAGKKKASGTEVLHKIDGGEDNPR